MPNQLSIGIAGVTGYAGQELLKLAARHPLVEVTAAMASGATDGGRTLPALATIWDGEITPLAVDRLAADTEAAFMALPEPVAAEVGPALVARGVRVFDLSGTFRLRDPEQRRRWYPTTPDLADPPVYGLTEHYRTELRTAQLVACPGCYPTAALLALRPLVGAALLEGHRAPLTRGDGGPVGCPGRLLGWSESVGGSSVADMAIRISATESIVAQCLRQNS